MRLADGRELIYFDDAAGAQRRLDDPRDLPPATTMSELRFDAVLDEWVTVASHRQSRTHLPPADQCPLCPSRDGRETEIPSDDYDVVVFENRFPSLAGTGDPAGFPGDDVVAATRPGHGRCEVVCFTSDHDAAFGSLPPARVATVIEAWIDRTVALGELDGVEQVFVFENRGEEIGVTLRHPHGQIYAYPFVTPRTRRMLDSAKRYAAATGDNLFAALLASEQKAEERIVSRSDHWTAFVPSAARWPVEVHLYPNRQLPDLAALDDAERAELPEVYLDLLRRLDGLYDLPMPYISGWHQAPVSASRELSYLHLQLFSIRRAPTKLKYLAGSESAMGAFINDVTPEQIAASLRGTGAG